MLPGSERVRVVVEKIDEMRGSGRVGDSFEVNGTALTLPPGGTFCPEALAVVLPIVVMRQSPLPADSWLIRKPWICGADARENLVMRVEGLDADEQESTEPGTEVTE
ncbi:MAG: hypothetical protein BGO47_06460 [Microbacterium sp. 67-17]|nr:MAG: hypothetical protein BGO47_06460 [Microbacterium sp. 67-17]